MRRRATEAELEWLKECNVQEQECECFYCPDSDTCEFAYDPYNVDDDCLNDK